MRLRRYAIAALLALGGHAALAQEGEAGKDKASKDTEFNRKGWYAGVGGAWGKDLFEEDIEGSLGGVVDVKDTGGVNLRFGRRLKRWFAFEIQYEWMDNFATTVDLGGETTLANFTTHTVTANAKILLLKNKRLAGDYPWPISTDHLRKT